MVCAALALKMGVEAQEDPLPNPVFPFGALIFRKSNPLEADWERDHKTAAPVGGQHLPPLVHVGGDRELAGQVRLARL